MRKRFGRRWIAMTLCLILAVVLGGCGEAQQENNRLNEILERGYITVTTEPYFAPNEFIDPSKEGDEQYVGADIELAKYIANELGVECRIVPLDFTTVLSSITEGKYDIAISALAYKPDRAENMNLSNSYYTSENSEGYGIAVRSDMVDQIQSVEDLADLVIVVQQGSLQQYFLEEQVPAYKEIKYVSSTNDAFLMVQEGKADAVATATSFARLYIDANEGCGISMVESFRFEADERYNGIVVAMKNGEDALLERINEIVDEVVENGIYQQWYDEYTEYAATLGL